MAMIALSANAQEELLKRFGIEEITPEMRALISAVLKHRYEVKGKVMGTDDFEPIPYPLQGANITLTCVADTTQFGGAAADKDGCFAAYIFCRNKLKDLRVKVKISYVGMETFEGVFTPTPDKDKIGDKLVVTFDSIVLKSNPVTTAEAEVIGELQKMYQRGDTTIFNAEAYEMPSGSVLLDLVRRLPGLRYEGGQLTYMGQSIEEMRLNGDTFFKHDINVALQNMPHDKLKSLKVYEVPDDTLDVNSNDHLVMDMQTKAPVNNLQFASVTAGITETLKNFRLSASGNTYVKGGAQVGVDFITRDLPSQGTPTRRSVNTNMSASYEQQLGKVHLDGNLNHSYSRTDSETEGFTQLFMPGFSQRTTSNTNSSSRSYSYRGHAILSGVIDSLTRWNSNLNISAGNSKNLNGSNNTITDDAGATVSTTTQSGLTHSNNRSISWNGSLNRYLNSEQRDEIGLRTDVNYSHSKSTTYNSTQSVFAQLGSTTQTTQHVIASPSDSYTLSGSAFYNHRFGKKNNVQLSYRASYTNDKNDERYYEPALATTDLASIDTLSYDKHNHQFTHNISASLLIDNNLMNLKLGMQVNPTRLVIENRRLDEVLSERNTYSTTIFVPSAQVKFKIAEGESTIQLHYDGRNSLPSISALTAATDYSDPMNIYTGNSNLKEAFTHSMGMEVKYKALLRATVNYSRTENQVTMLTRLDPLTGARQTMPENINGNWNITSYLFLTKQIDEVSFNLMATHTHSNNVSFVQTSDVTGVAKSSTKWDNYNLAFISGYTNANWVLAGTAVYNIDHRKNEYMATSSNGKSFNAQGRIDYTSTNGAWHFSTDFNWQKRFDYELASANTSDFIWSLASNYRFLKGKRASVGITWNDILNRNRGFQATMTDTQWSETQTLGKTSYVLFTFSYRLSLLH
jgi:hypothetical protein